MSGGVVEAVVADHERSTGPWEIEWIVLPQIVRFSADVDLLPQGTDRRLQCALSHACLKQTQYLLEGLEVNEEGMQRNLALSKGAIVSEAVMMGLGKSIGRQCQS